MDTNYSHLMDQTSHPTQRPLDVRTPPQVASQGSQGGISSISPLGGGSSNMSPADAAVTGKGIY